MRKIFSCILVLLAFFGNAQTFDIKDVAILEDDEIVFYFIEKYKIIRQVSPFSVKDSLAYKAYLKNYGFEEKDYHKNSKLNFYHFWVAKLDTIAPNLFQNSIIYFVGDREEAMESILFSSLDKTPKTDIDESALAYVLERKRIERCVLGEKSFPFVGKTIEMQENWKWQTVNDLSERTSFSRMNWSVHKKRSAANESRENQIKLSYVVMNNHPNGMVKVLLDTKVPIFFENVKTKARKIIFLETTKVPVSEEDSPEERKLIVYYIVEKIRDRYVACTLSFYESDLYGENDLPPLLAKFLKL